MGLRKDAIKSPRGMHTFSNESHFTLTFSHLRISYPLIHVKSEVLLVDYTRLSFMNQNMDY